MKAPSRSPEGKVSARVTWKRIKTGWEGLKRDKVRKLKSSFWSAFNCVGKLQLWLSERLFTKIELKITFLSVPPTFFLNLKAKELKFYWSERLNGRTRRGWWEGWRVSGCHGLVSIRTRFPNIFEKISEESTTCRGHDDTCCCGNNLLNCVIDALLVPLSFALRF